MLGSWRLGYLLAEKGSRDHHGQGQMLPLTGTDPKDMLNAPLSLAGVKMVQHLS